MHRLLIILIKFDLHYQNDMIHFDYNLLHQKGNLNHHFYHHYFCVFYVNENHLLLLFRSFAILSNFFTHYFTLVINLIIILLL